MHDRLVWLILEVAVPSRQELWERPILEILEFLLTWPNLHTSFDAICGKWTHAVDIPLVDHGLLNLGVTTDEVVERLSPWFRSVRGEVEIVVLEVQTNAGKFDQGLNASFPEFLRVTNT